MYYANSLFNLESSMCGIDNFCILAVRY